MGFVAESLPPPDELVELPPDEIGLQLLDLIVNHQQGHLLDQELFIRQSSIAAEWGEDQRANSELHDAMLEAFQWLVSERLIMKGREVGFDRYQHQVTRRGRQVAEKREGTAAIAAEKRINVDLHPALERRVRRQFILGEYEAAALLAMKEVEIAVRRLAKAKPEEVGVNLMRAAFAPVSEKRPEGGPITDTSQPVAEQEATMALFAGAIGVFKNPSSHREVEYDDATFASEVVLLADLLLRMLDRRIPHVAYEAAKAKIERQRTELARRIEEGSVSFE